MRENTWEQFSGIFSPLPLPLVGKNFKGRKEEEVGSAPASKEGTTDKGQVVAQSFEK